MLELICGATGAIICLRTYNKYEFIRKQCTKVRKKLSFYKKYHPHIVKFEDKNKYAIRRFDFMSLKYEYKDLRAHYVWRGLNDHTFYNCLETLENCQKEIEKNKKTKDFGTPV